MKSHAVIVAELISAIQGSEESDDVSLTLLDAAGRELKFTEIVTKDNDVYLTIEEK